MIGRTNLPFRRTFVAFSTSLALLISHGAWATPVTPQSQPSSGEWLAATDNFQPIICGRDAVSIPRVNTITTSNDPSADGSGAQNFKDIRGDSTRPAAYQYSDTNYLYFRIRLRESPEGGGSAYLGNASWGLGFDTDGVTSNGWEYGYLVSASGSASQGRFIVGTSGAVLTDSPNYSAESAGWVNYSPAGSSFDSKPN